MAAPSSRMTPSLSFTLFPSASVTSQFGPRLGQIILQRANTGTPNTILTPGLLTPTRRGVVPHLSHDHYAAAGTGALGWVHVPFESFLEHTPPAPTAYAAPLHSFLCFPPSRHILSMSARDPADVCEVPANGNGFVCTTCLRGVRKLTPAAWKSYVRSCRPDVAVALSDNPHTPAPHSQKRLSKSIERSIVWLADFLRADEEGAPPTPVLLHMVGGVSLQARQAFADRLREPLDGAETTALAPLCTLDDGVWGYVFEAAALRKALENDLANPHKLSLAELLRVSLAPLPVSKPRVAHTTQTPHEVLRLISDVGVDVFDTHWAQRAASVGVALDFMFPAPEDATSCAMGRNLYDALYARDFDSLSANECICATCLPTTPSRLLQHGGGDPSTPVNAQKRKLPVTRAYLHHLLHTHEMSAHTLLTLHNLAVLDAFFGGVRAVLRDMPRKWEEEANRFAQVYDEDARFLYEAEKAWLEVDVARGKGRLAREKIKAEAALGDVVVPEI